MIGEAVAIHADRTTDLDRLLDSVVSEQEEIFLARQPRSRTYIDRARRSLAGGVTSSWQITRPQAVWLTHGSGSKVYDVDGTEYVDLHGGYGAGLAGHAHPAIVEAVRNQVTRGTHFAQPTEDAFLVAEELARRFGLPLWRFTNSGTESTMDAVHLMRAITGRDLIVKVEGCYHGHHDSVQVSVQPDEEDAGPADRPNQVIASSGIPRAIAELTLIVGFNDLAAVARLLEEHKGKVAGMILEPIMMNAGIIHPDPGYLEGLADLLHAHGALLCFDEVKTGLTVGPGGATAALEVRPDIACLAKSLGGGLITGALGGTAEVMEHVANDDYEMVGTFNGNPLSLSAARAMLYEVSTPEAYERLSALRAEIDRALGALIDKHDLPAHVVSIGAKGCATFSTEPVRNYRDFLAVDDRYNHAHWLMQHNGGVFLPPWGKTEQWLISVQHSEDDVDRFVSNFARFAEAVST
jgi:glutamate-1-semialdehyde 2,1-aminomutase